MVVPIILALSFLIGSTVIPKDESLTYDLKTKTYVEGAK